MITYRHDAPPCHGGACQQKSLSHPPRPTKPHNTPQPRVAKDAALEMSQDGHADWRRHGRRETFRVTGYVKRGTYFVRGSVRLSCLSICLHIRCLRIKKQGEKKTMHTILNSISKTLTPVHLGVQLVSEMTVLLNNRMFGRSVVPEVRCSLRKQ